MRLAVAQLYCYPLKGARGFTTRTLRFGFSGPEWDHVFLIVDADTGEFVTQRRAEGKGIAIKEMCFVRVDFNPGWTQLRLEAPGMLPLSIPLSLHGRPIVPVSIWGHETQAHDMGPRAQAWVTEYLSCYRQGNYRLVRMADPRPTTTGPTMTSFTDGYQVLVVHDASLADLNRRVAQRQAGEGEPVTPIGWDRIRPTLVLTGGLPGRRAYIEDRLDEIVAGEVVLIGETPCPRCALTQIDQGTAQTGKEPMRTLKAYRTGLNPVKPGVPCFGHYFNAKVGGGVITVGDTVVVRRRRLR